MNAAPTRTGREMPDSSGDAAPQRSIGNWAPAVAIALTIALAVAVSLVRARRGTVDLWFDDSWVALSTRAPLSKAIHMGMTAPGFTVVARWWIGLSPDSISWAQSFALLGLVVSPIVVFVAARAAGAARWSATTIACLTALNPMLLAESARLKQYTWEYALSAAMVAVAAALRRDGPTARWTVGAGALVVVATAFSGSMLIPSALLFLVLGVALWTAVRRAHDPLPIRVALGRLALATVAGVIVLTWAAIFLLHPTGALQHWWRVRGGFLGSSGSVSATAHQALSLLRGFMAEFIFGGGTPLLVVPVALLAWYSWRRWRTVWWLLLAPLLAIVLSVTQRYPLATIGRARVEAWLMPWVAVLLALALGEIAEVVRARDLASRVPRPLATAAIAMAALVLAAVAWQRTTHYPPTRARAALDAAAAFSGRGPIYLADGDFPAALVLRRPITFVTDRRKDQDFTYVLSGHDLRTLHAGQRAASELRPACGGTAMIVGAHREDVVAAIEQAGCRIVRADDNTQGTSESHDDTLTVTLSPAAARP